MVSIYVIYLILGCIGYALFIFADFNKTKKIHPAFNYAFAIGILLLFYSTLRILQIYPASFKLPGLWPLVFFTLAFLSLAIQFYILFFAIPFNETYVEIGEYEIVDTGFFGTSRHPGVIWFFFFYFFLWVGTGKTMIVWAGIIWTLADIIHVYLQDRYFFPRMFKDYDVYIREVPFMIPTKRSLNNLFKK